MEIEVGKEYSYLNQPVRVERVSDGMVEFKTRFEEYGTCNEGDLGRWGPPPQPTQEERDQQEANDIEMEAADDSYDAGLGVSEWEAFLSLKQTKRLIELAERGAGTWAREPARLEQMKRQVSRIESKTN